MSFWVSVALMGSGALSVALTGVLFGALITIPKFSADVLKLPPSSPLRSNMTREYVSVYISIMICQGYVYGNVKNHYISTEYQMFIKFN